MIAGSAGIGFRVARAHRVKEDAAPVGPIVGATLGLLAFMLAITFGQGASRHDARRQLVLAEATALQTLDLRATLIGDEPAQRVRTLLIEYVDLRLDVAREPGRLAAALVRSDELQRELWSIAREAGRSPESPRTVGLFVSSVNEIIELQTRRLTMAAYDRIPVAIWVGLLSLTVLGMAVVGYHAGMAGSARVLPLVVLVLAFTSVVLLIRDLDRPRDGLLVVGQQPLEDLQRALQVPR